MDAIRTSLKQVLSDVFIMYTESHIFHWNVEGRDFLMFHELFGRIYQDVYESVDNVAERLRAVGGYAPFNVRALLSHATIDDTPPLTDPVQMANRLLTTNAAVIESLKQANLQAEQAGLVGTSNYLADRIDTHMKWNWFLRSSTKKEQ